MSRPGIPLIHDKRKSKKERCLYFILGVDNGKAKILSRLGINQLGDGYCHFPDDEKRRYDQIYFKGLISEHQVVKKVKGKKRLVWEKRESNRRNEPLDVRNYAQAAFEVLTINWDALEKRVNSYENQSQKVQNKPNSQPKRPPKKRYGVVNKGISA
jgi:phage terminase large subunit GpA-like protein